MANSRFNRARADPRKCLRPSLLHYPTLSAEHRCIAIQITGYFHHYSSYLLGELTIEP